MKCPKCGKSLWFLRDFCVFCKTAIAAPPRPRSVAVIGWLAIVSGIGTAFVLWKARDVVAMTAMAYAEVVIKLVCGAVLLRGMNWARWVFALWLVYAGLHRLVAGMATMPAISVLQVLLFSLVLYYLFRPAANAFFAGAASLAERLPPGQAKCRECSKVFPVGEMIQHDGAHICVACKPRFLQKLREGVQPGVAP